MSIQPKGPFDPGAGQPETSARQGEGDAKSMGRRFSVKSQEINLPDLSKSLPSSSLSSEQTAEETRKLKEEEWAIKHVIANWKNLEKLSPELRGNKKVVLAAFRRPNIMDMPYMPLKFASDELKNDPEVVSAAVKVSSTALQFASAQLRDNSVFLLSLSMSRIAEYASPRLLADKQFALAILQGYAPLGIFSEELRKDRDVVSAAIKRSQGSELYEASEELKNDKEFLLPLVKDYPNVFRYANPGLRGDREFVLAAFNAFGAGDLLRDVTNDLKDDREVVLAALQRGSTYTPFQYASERLKKDKELVLAAVEGYYSSDSDSPIKYASETLRNDPDVILAAIRKYAKETFKRSPDDVYHAMIRIEKALSAAGNQIKNDEKFIIACVTICGRCLQLVGQQFQNNEKVVLAAIQNYYKAFNYASHEIRNNSTLVLKAVGYNWRILEFIGDKLKNDRNFILKLIEINFDFLSFASDALKQDIKFMSEIAEKNLGVLRFAKIDPKQLELLYHLILSVPQNTPCDYVKDFSQQNILEKFIYFMGCADHKDKIWWMKIIEEIIKRDPKLALKVQATGKTLLEKIYFKAVHNGKKMDLLITMAKGLKGDLGDSIFDDMQKRILINGEAAKWLPLLPEIRQMHLEKILKSKPSKIGDLQLKLAEVTESLKRQLRFYNLNPEEMDAQLITEAHLLKKEVKRLLKFPPPDSDVQLLENLRESYHKFVDIYDKVVDSHPIYAQIRFFSREIKKSPDSAIEKLSIRKFLALWTDRPLTPQVWKEESLLIRKRISDAHRYVMSLSRRRRWLTLLHGTNSSALPIIRQTGNKLQSFSKLIQMDIAPLTGEGMAASQNIKGISTLTPDHSWNQPEALLPGNRTTRFLISEGYSVHVSQKTELMPERALIFDADKEMGIIADAMTRIGEPDNGRRFWFDLKRAIIRLKMTENDKFTRLSNEKGWIEKLQSFPQDHAKNNEINELLRIWQSAPKIQVDPRDPLIVNRYPMLFASTSYYAENPDQSNSSLTDNFWQSQWEDGTGENLIEQDLELGRDLDLIFTSQEGMAELQRAFPDQNVRVLPLDAGRYMQMRQMIMSDASKMDVDSDITPDSLHQLSRNFQRDILPYYASLLPEKPIFIDAEGNLEKETHPYYGFTHNYSEYIKAVRSGDVLPRTIHGSPHAVRVSLYSHMLANIYASKGIKAEVSPILVMFTAGMHDSARQADGEDHWDGESAQLLRHHLRDQLRVSDVNKLDLVTEAIRDKDPKPEIGYKSIVQRIVHDADALDVSRALINPATDFRLGALAFTKMPEFNDFPTRDLANEVIEFTRLTENPALKKYLEDNSKNYLKDMILIFRTLNGDVSNPKFPIMSQYLKLLIDALLPADVLDPKIIDIISSS